MNITTLPFAAAFLFGFLAFSATPSESKTPLGDCRKSIADRQPKLLEASCTILLNRTDLTQKERAEALYFRGFGRLYARNNEAAGKDFDEGLALAPNHNRMHRQRGWVALRQSDLEKAFFHARKALELYPQGSEQHHLLASVYLRVRQTDKALEYFNNAISLKDDHVWSRYERAIILMDRQNYKDAFKDTERLMKIEPDDLNRQGNAYIHTRYVDLNTAVNIRHATTLAGLGKFEASERVLNKLVENHRNAITLVARSELLASFPFDGKRLKNRGPDAIRDLESAVRLDPIYSHAWRSLALRLLSATRFDAALAANEQAISTNRVPVYVPELLWERAMILRSLGKTAEAVDFGVSAMKFAFRIPSRYGIVARRISNLRMHGYWQSAELPSQLNQDVVDATTACFHDPACW